MSETKSTLPAKLSALPESWIEKIFGHMGDYYGSLFSDRWKDSNIASVKRTWAEALANFTDHPECFRLALKAMIDECRMPPTLPEFVALCRKHYVRPEPQQKSLPDMSQAPLSREEGRKRLAALKSKYPSMKRVLDAIPAE